MCASAVFLAANSCVWAIEPGDIVYRKGCFGLPQEIIGRLPVGHAAIYLGGGGSNGKGAMVVEAMPNDRVPPGVRKMSLGKFIAGWPYYGNRTVHPKPTQAQRSEICASAQSLIGLPFDETHFVQKGPDKYDCVGLTEKAYELAGLNPSPDEMESGWGWPLTPKEQFDSTFPNEEKPRGLSGTNFKKGPPADGGQEGLVK